MRALFSTVFLSIFLLAGNSSDVFSGSPARSGFRQQQTENPSASVEVVRINAAMVELFKAKKYDEALPLAKRVLELQQKAYGPSDGHTAAALHNLAEIYFAKGNPNEAGKLFEQALAIYEHGPQRESLVESSLLERLAALAYEGRDYVKAVPLLERSLAIREKLLGKDNLQVAETLWGLGDVHGAERRYDLAKPSYVRALSIKEAKFGSSDPKTVESMRRFACIDLFSRSSRYKKDPDQEDEMEPIVKKSYCWLSELKDDCATAPQGKSQGVINGKALKLPLPLYPLQARGVNAQGRVLVAVLIDESGRVAQAKPVCGGHPTFNDVALIAARKAEFEPTVIDGKPVQTTGVITYNFVAPRR